jgi:hypothetical protein
MDMTVLEMDDSFVSSYSSSGETTLCERMTFWFLAILSLDRWPYAIVQDLF